MSNTNVEYRVVRNCLAPREAAQLAYLLQEDILQVVVGDSGPMVDPGILTSASLRKELLDDPKKVWRNGGNSRDPKLPKTTGLVNIYLNRDLMRARASPQVVAALRAFHGEHSIVFNGLERPMYKGKGSIDSGVTPAPARGEVLSFICLSGQVGARKRCGSISLLCGYLENEERLSAILREERKDVGCLLKDLERYNTLLSKEGSKVRLEWVTPPLSPGDVLTWRVPYYTQRNLVDAPFSGVYTRTVLASEAWYTSRVHREMEDGLKRGIVGFLSPRGSLSNSDEYKHRTKGGAWTSLVGDLSEEEGLLYGVERYAAHERRGEEEGTRSPRVEE